MLPIEKTPSDLYVYSDFGVRLLLDRPWDNLGVLAVRLLEVSGMGNPVLSVDGSIVMMSCR